MSNLRNTPVEVLTSFQRRRRWTPQQKLFTSDSFGSRVGLINFNFTAKWRFKNSKFKQSMPNFLKVLIGAFHRHTRHLSGSVAVKSRAKW